MASDAPPRAVSPETVWTLAVCVVALVALSATMALTPLTPVNQGRDLYDGRWYAAMALRPALLVEEHGPVPTGLGLEAEGLERFPTAPFCWRVLSPLIVHAMLGIGIAWQTPVSGFFMLSFFAQWAATILLWLLFRRLGVPHRLALFGVAIHLLAFWGPRYAFWSPCHPESLTFALGVALLLAIVSGKPWITAALFAVAALQREQLMTLALFQALWLWAERRTALWRAFALATLIALPGIAVTVALRVVIEPVNPKPISETLLFYLRLRADHVREDGVIYLVRWFAGTVIALGAVPGLWLAAGRAGWRDARALVPWLAMALVTWLLAWSGGVDCGRRVYYAMPLVLAPLLMRWPRTPLGHATWVMMVWALLWHAVVNVAMVNLDSPGQMVKTTLAMFMAPEDVWLFAGLAFASLPLVACPALFSRSSPTTPGPADTP